MKRFIALSVLLSFALYLSLSASDAEINRSAPGFTLVDSNGDEHSLSDFEGKIIVLEWINFGCPFVQKHYKSGNMQNLQNKYTGKGIIWLLICSSAPGKQGNLTNEEINAELDELNTAQTAYLIDESGEVGQAYGAKTTPHMYIIDEEGILVYAGGIDDIKSTDVEDIEKAVNYVAEGLDYLLDDMPVQTQVSAPYGCSVKY
ncbi:MAG: thioredoxin family protein [Ignavibacteriae bacterium]|nr:thioredoxin family protein [Ignavibacteriota bacterium]NOG96487.1 thioredoxin family protein [Ignavibacteriota bacterium]